MNAVRAGSFVTAMASDAPRQRDVQGFPTEPSSGPVPAGDVMAERVTGRP